MILIVDDKAENIFSLKKTLEVSGFEVDSADSGEEALKKILKQSYSLIILDVQMPGMDGFEVAETISGYSKSKDIPIIFLSAVNTDKKFIAKGYTSGGVDYVTKPVDPDLFILKVKTLHRLHEQNRELNNIRLTLLEEVDVRKKAESELNKRLFELKSVLEAMPQIAFTIKNNGTVEFANEHWYVYSTLINKLPVFHPDDQHIHEAFEEAFKNGIPFTSEVRIKNLLTNTYRYHLLKVTPVKQGKTILKWVGTFTDIQEQKAANELLETKVKERTVELQTKNKELEESNYDLQQFASVASHDLKEPLRKIQVFSSIIKNHFPDDNKLAHASIDKVIEASQRMSGLITDLLDYSRLSVQTLFAKTDISEIAKDILRDLEFTITEKNATITISKIPEIDAIQGQIRQVFQNLISNSLKFTHAGTSPVINIEAETISIDDQELCRITIQDNGIGFDDQYKEKIFTIFQRLNSKEAYEGTGIGLAIVKKIVDKHNGTIAAHSTEGKGATFVMTLPVRQQTVSLTTETTHQ
jgi:signal transduction histidine kinase/DNA-binding response OmpR family regulator